MARRKFKERLLKGIRRWRERSKKGEEKKYTSVSLVIFNRASDGAAKYKRARPCSRSYVEKGAKELSVGWSPGLAKSAKA